MACYARRNHVLIEYRLKQKNTTALTASDIHGVDEDTCGLPDAYTGIICSGTSNDFYSKENRMVCGKCGRGRQRLVDQFSGIYDRESTVHYPKRRELVQMYNG